ncbi:MAG: hypothetical protein FJ255_10140 [Phycisphaerae bacterium]|nr:hypothetical protein [Phycisphaerae bacterium]
MLKSLNKYKKWILVVGGSLLMVAFLLPEAIRNLKGDPRDEVVGLLAGSSLRAGDVMLAEQEFQALNQVVPDILQSVGPVSNGVHWLLIAREAERAGLVAGAREGEDMLTGDLVDQMVMRTVRQNPQLLRSPADLEALRERVRITLPPFAEQAATNARMTMDQMHKALAKVKGVLRLVGSYAEAARLSDKRTLLRASELGAQAVIDFFTVRARDLAAAEPQPTPEQLQAHFARFRDVPQGTGEFGIGYTLPARVKVQYLSLEMNDLRAAVKADPVDVRKRYLAQRAVYPGEFEAERARIESALREAKAADVMADAVKLVQAEVRKRTQKLETEDQYRTLPSDWPDKRPRFEEIAQFVVEGIKSTHGLDLPLPTVSTRAAAWFTADDLRAIPDLGVSVLRHGQTQISMDAAALVVRELASEARPIIIQVGVPYVEGPFIDMSTEARRFLLVLDARDQSPPDSIDELGTSIVDDYKAMRVYERLASEVSATREAVAQAGLDEAAKSFAAPPPAGQPGDPTTPQIRRLTTVQRDGVMAFDPVLSGDTTFAKAVLEAAATLDPLTPPVSPLPPGSHPARTVVVPIPGTLGLAAGQVVARRPLTLEQFQQAAGRVATRMGMDELLEQAGEAGFLEPFAQSALAKRLGLKWRRGEGDAPKGPAPAGS